MAEVAGLSKAAISSTCIFLLISPGRYDSRKHCAIQIRITDVTLSYALRLGHDNLSPHSRTSLS
jgi:hypothetical protein